MMINNPLRVLYLALILLTTAPVALGQGRGWILENDTLYSPEGAKIYPGQKLIVGHQSGNDGWYHTIGFKTGLNISEQLFREAELNNNADYKNDPQRRTNDKVASLLAPGDTLTVLRLKRRGNKRAGHWFSADLKSGKFLTPRFRSTIDQAIEKKELFLPGDRPPGQ
jgi:hypothetical protein